MPGQIVNITNEEAISEVALQCGDPFFKDFPRIVYSQAVYRAERGIAKDYGIMDRNWSTTNLTGADYIEIEPLNFNGAWRVTVTPEDGTETEYSQAQYDEVADNSDTTNYIYAVIFNANKYSLYYTFPAENDSISIWYTSSIAGEEDYEYYDSDGNLNAIPVLPNKYFEEVVRRAVRYLAKLGVAQFTGEKLEKYSRILQMHSRVGDEQQEPGLYKSREWIQIKPFQYP